jgi:N-acetylmuramoyl-L-alanine amidase
MPNSLTQYLILTAILLGFGKLPAVAQVAEQAEPPRLRIVFPADGDTLDSGRVRYAGSVLDTTMQVMVNGTVTRVYPSGAFVGLVPLRPGDNLIVFEAADTTGAVVRDSLRLFRRPLAETLAETPSRVVEVWPKRDIWLEPGAQVQVQIRATPGGKASFSVPGIIKNAPLIELPPDETGGINGIYRAVFRVPLTAKKRATQVRYKFKGADGKTHKPRSAGRIQVLDPRLPLVGVTVDSTNLLRTAPRGAIWTVLPEGIRLQVVGMADDYFRVRLAEGRDAYTAVSNLRLLPRGTPPARATVRSIGGGVAGDWVRLRINLSGRVPYKISEQPDPPALLVTFFGARQGSEWVTYPAGDTTVRLITWRQEAEDIHTLRVDLNQRQLWGFDGRYVGNQFWLEIRRTPDFAAVGDSLFKALIIAVDPGHGGEEPGAIGATGLMEKDVNLAYATRVAELLRQEGARVIQTRTTDTTMTLLDRVKIARAANAHLFVWLHNNSIGAASNPVAVRGTSTYFTVPQAMEIARQVYPRLLQIGLPPFGRISSTYFITRQTSMVTFLVEGAFVSNPLDEMLLMDGAFLDRLAEAVVSGIKDFLRQVAPRVAPAAGGQQETTETNASPR